ncbi:MAG: hypothetical protein EZS28_041079, partial [Streblomastix strix]
IAHLSPYVPSPVEGREGSRRRTQKSNLGLTPIDQDITKIIEIVQGSGSGSLSMQTYNPYNTISTFRGIGEVGDAGTLEKDGGQVSISKRLMGTKDISSRNTQTYGSFVIPSSKLYINNGLNGDLSAGAVQNLQVLSMTQGSGIQQKGISVFDFQNEAQESIRRLAESSGVQEENSAFKDIVMNGLSFDADYRAKLTDDDIKRMKEESAKKNAKKKKKKKAAPTKTTKGGKNDVEEEPKKEKGKEFPGALFVRCSPPSPLILQM